MEIEVIRDELGKIIEIKGVPCLQCESINTHCYVDVFFCIDCKAKVHKEVPQESIKPKTQFHHEYPNFR